MALSQTTVLKFYRSVMEDVIAGARELLLDDGLDEQVLMELRHIWETKLLSSKAIDMSPEHAEPQPPVVTAHHGTTTAAAVAAATSGTHTLVTAPSATGAHAGNHFQGGNSNNIQQQQHHPPLASSSATNSATAIVADANKTVPVQITLPPQAGSSDSHPRVLTIQVPASALQGNQLHSVLSGPVISATMALPLHLATSLLQQHVTTALQGQLQVAAASATNAGLSNANSNALGSSNSIVSMPQHLMGKASSLGAKGVVGTVRQLDGAGDTSDDDDDDDDEEEEEGEEGEGGEGGKGERDDDDDDDDDGDDGEGEEGEGGAEEEPLNSEDDVSDEDPTDLFDTDNVVVCQYDKITRSRNKWKFYLKDGIMNLGGKDFVFQRANGDAEW